MLVLKFWFQVAFYSLLGVFSVGFSVGNLLRGGDPMLWGPVLGAQIVVICYLLWVYRARIELPGSSTVIRGARQPEGAKGRIALTFDDGPNGEDTVAILDTLRRHNAKATFFCVGKWAARQPEILRRMEAEGHSIGNHTQDHQKLGWLSRAQIAAQIDAAQDSIATAGVARPRLFRAPHGVKNPFLFSVLRERGMRLIAWSEDIQDFQRPGVSWLVRRAKPGLRDGEIMLMHDGDGRTWQADRKQTAAALDEILAECARRGLSCVTVPELIGP